MGSKGSNTTTTTTAPPAWVNQAYQSIYGRAEDAASAPYSPYTGQAVAGFVPDQQSAFGTVNAAQGMAQPYIDQGMAYNAQGAAPVSQLTAGDINMYQNPWQNMVTDATMANINETNAQQMQKLQGNAALQGAMGGDRMGVAKAELARQQNLSNNQTLANLSAQGFHEAANLATGQQAVQQQNAQRAAQAAYGAGSLGQQAQGATLQGAQAQLATGAQQQQNTQAGLDWLRQQWNEQQAFPYAQTGWLAGIGTGLGSGAGGTSATTAPAPNPLGQFAGIAAAGAGAYFSDERMKDDIEQVGELYDGQPVYRYRYNGDPRMQIGLMAQDVEDTAPEAVGNVGGMKTVNYDAATDAAAVRGRFAQGGAPGGAPSPMFGGVGFIPQTQMTRGAGPPPPPKASGGDNAASMMDRAVGMAAKIGRKYGEQSGDPMSLAAPGVEGYAPAAVGDYMPFAPQSGLGPGPYARGGQVPHYADGGWEEYVPPGIPLPRPRPEEAPSPITPVQGGMFGGMGFKPMDWPDAPIAPQGPPAPQAPVVADLPPQMRRQASVAPGMRYTDDEADPLVPMDGDQPIDTSVPSIPDTPGLAPRAPTGLVSDEPSEFNPAGGVSTPGGGGSKGINWKGPFSDDWKPNMPLIAAGFGMLASKSPNLGNVIGEGGLAGMTQYASDKKMEATATNQAENRKLKKSEIDLRVKQLAQQAAHWQAQLAETSRRTDLTNANQKAGIKQRDDAARLRAEQENWTPPVPGEAPGEDGKMVPGMVTMNRKTRETQFIPNMVLTPKGGVKPPPSSPVEREADRLEKLEPGLPREEYLKRATAAMAKPTAAKESTTDREFAKADVKAIGAYAERARLAQATLADIEQLEGYRKQVGYSGTPVSGVIATGAGIFNKGAGQKVQSKATELQLGFTQRTKGAISDREMALFGTATPGLSMSDDAANSIIGGWKAGNMRVAEQARFMEAYHAKHNNLRGAQAAWDRFINERPILVPGDKGSFTINTGNIGAWQDYVDGVSAPTGAPKGDALAPTAPATPAAGGKRPLPPGVPTGSLWSESQQKWRSPDKKFFDPEGKPIP